jgi:hypothetical protein
VGVQPEKLVLDDWYTKRKVLPRSQWKASHGSKWVGYTGDHPGWSQLKSSKDFTLCPECGGSGWRWVNNGHKQSLIKCDCPYAAVGVAALNTPGTQLKAES